MMEKCADEDDRVQNPELLRRPRPGGRWRLVDVTDHPRGDLWHSAIRPIRERTRYRKERLERAACRARRNRRLRADFSTRPRQSTELHPDRNGPGTASGCHCLDAMG